METATLAATILVLTLAALLLRHTMASTTSSTQDAREPPAAPSLIPIVGHVVGLMRNGSKYLVQLSQSTKLPIFTLSLPGQKIYVITTPEYIQNVQKQYKAIAWPPAAARFATTVCGSSAEAQKVLDVNVNEDQGPWGLSHDSNAGMRAALKPGAGLDGMNRVMMENVVASLDEIKPEKGQTRKVMLSEWLRELVTLATTNSVYGPHNPHKDPEIKKAFWTFEKGLVSIFMGILPSVIARGPIQARDKVAKRFERYFSEGHHKQGSQLTQNRYEYSTKHGLSIADIARFEVGGSIAVLTNTSPATYWMLLLVHATPGLLAEIRKEVDAVTAVDGATGKRTIDMTTLKENSPLLISTFQETLRWRSMGTSIREVVEDTLFDGWLLKAGSMVQIPSRVIHSDAAQWGTDVDEFNPRRFMKDTVHKTTSGKKPSDICFRAFGGGRTLCPGRHFSTNEVLAVVALFVARYELRPAGGQGWKIPSTENSNPAGVLMEPDYDMEVEIENREGEGLDKATWAVELRPSDKIFAVVAEDKSGAADDAGYAS